MSNGTSFSPNPTKRYIVEKEKEGRIKWGNSQQEGRSRKIGKEERERERERGNILEVWMMRIMY